MVEFQHFRREEFACKCGCERNEIDDGFVLALDRLRAECGFPFVIRSGWRCERHPAEIKKEKPGRHHDGVAADIEILTSSQRFILLERAMNQGGFNGIGIGKSFVHVDRRGTTPVIWLY